LSYEIWNKKAEAYPACAWQRLYILDLQK